MKRTKKSRKPAQATKRPRPAASKARSSNHSIEVRESGVHGRGVFAARPIRKGQRVIEYAGRRISWKKAMELPDTDPNNPNHTMFFGLEGGKVIDPSVGGNEARWINHSCAPNCETDEIKGRIYVVALRNLKPGDELSYDYRLEVEGRRTKKLERDFACYCGATTCRGNMLEPVE
jgi:SET domain-containing protein